LITFKVSTKLFSNLSSKILDLSAKSFFPYGEIKKHKDEIINAEYKTTAGKV